MCRSVDVWSWAIMWETIAIIVTLGGLEFTLWVLDRRAAKLDHEMQRKQLEILDGILTELAIQNSEETSDAVPSEAEEEARDESARRETADRTQEHSVCN
jgi:hypothetical protein